MNYRKKPVSPLTPRVRPLVSGTRDAFRTAPSTRAFVIRKKVPFR